METLIAAAKWVGASTVIAGGILAVGKSKFVTKKDCKDGQHECQGSVLKTLGKMEAKADKRHDEYQSSMRDISQFMGRVNATLEKNGG